ncbi:MAG: hypothetical protein K8R69_03080, partial [Deltaproteobacteria bacterium]|nr:hypothetical protein [Deltaproteobacteria bacterium]
QALGAEVEWNASALGRDLASSYLVLGAMKAVGGLGATAYRRSGAVSGFSRHLFGQSALFGGILLGHRLEVLTGIRPSGDAGGTLVDSLALLLQFNIAGRLSRRLGCEAFSNWENYLDSQAATLGSSQVFFPSRVPETPMFGPAFAMAGIGDRDHLNSSSPPQVISTTFPPSSWPAYESYYYPPGGNGPRPPGIRYQPEVRRLWETLEPVLREVPFEATAEEILRRRADFESADLLWLEQIRDFSELVGGHVEVYGPDRLLEPWTSQFLKPRADLLAGAMAITEGKGRVYEISLPYADARFGRPTEKGQYAGLQHILSELETSFGDQVLLANVQQGRLRVRFPNFPLWEALLMARFGNQVHRLVLVDGEIPRDDVMRLRGKLLAPVGLSRQPLFVGEMKGRVHPFFFVLHDLFHATNVCMLPPQLSRTSHRLYFIAKRELPASDIKEEHLNRLADMDPGSDFRGNPGIFVDFSLRPFWDGIRRDVLSEDVAWRRFQRFPKFLNAYDKMLNSHPPENPEDSHWHEAFRLRVQDYKNDFSNLLRRVLRN